MAPFTRTARIWPETGDLWEFFAETLKNSVSALFFSCRTSGRPERSDQNAT
jgi:hypothetical protein